MQRVAAHIRPSSLTKPATEALRAAGVEIRQGDIHDSVEQLQTALSGVDVLIIAGTGLNLPDQKDIIRAAKNVNVKRVIPCDFATPGAKGVRQLHDIVRLHQLAQTIDMPAYIVP